MIKKIAQMGALMLMSMGMIVSCTDRNETAGSDGKLKMVTTTTYMSDLAKVITGDKVELKNLCGPGVDPHTYVATLSDVRDLESAAIIAYSGVGLEAQLAKILTKLKDGGAQIICAADSVKPEMFLEFDEDGEIVQDPHIWNDVNIWMDVAKGFTAKMVSYDPANAAYYEANLAAYLQELEELNTYVINRVAEIPEESRVVITVHDAFEYMAKAYGLEVDALNGLSTATEAGTKDISNLAEKIAANKIKAIFMENSANPEAMAALKAAVQAKGGDVTEGGELFSDALGDEETGCDTYIKVIKGNIDTIVNALK